MFQSSPRTFCTRAGLIAFVGLGLTVAPVLAHPIPAFKFDCPTFYIQAALELNPTFGAHPFFYLVPPTCPALPPPPPPLAVSWDTPATLSLAGTTITATGSSTHLIALHAGEAAPATIWPFSISVAAPPPPFGAVETRIRRSINHPGGPHNDNYMAVVGGLIGTAPGPSLAPRFVIIHGSIGKHLDTPPPPAPQPITVAGPLTPPSGLPSAGNQDFPSGELITIVDPAFSNFSLLLIVDGVPGPSIGSVFVRNGSPFGPVMIDLRPLMHLHQFNSHATALAIGEAPIPASIVQLMASGQAFITMHFPPSIHPDAQIVGQLTAVDCGADLDCDGHVNGVDLAQQLAQWTGAGMYAPCPPFKPADLNHDCRIDGLDLALLLAQWG